MINLARISRAIDFLNEYVGRGAAWTAVIMVVMQFVVVILRYVFSYGNIPMQESIWYMHGILFMMGSGYTLLHDGHVRVDILYREMPPKRKAIVNLTGMIIFLGPICYLAWSVSWSYVINSWKVLEGSIEISGLPFIYLLKTVILLFTALLFLQGISMALKSILVLAGADKEMGKSKEPELV